MVPWLGREIDQRAHTGWGRAGGILLLCLVAAIASGCVPIVSGRAPPNHPTSSSPVSTPPKVATYAPATTSTVPIILAARQMSQPVGGGESLALTIFTNHSQANTLFLRGDVDLLVTGLSVGLGFYKNGAPVQVINCNVVGLTYLVTNGHPVNSFRALEGEPLYLPFEGSPIEETSRFFAEREGLAWQQDIKPIYAPFESSLALLRQGKIAAAALPEPYVSLAEQEAKASVAISYRQRWDDLTGSTHGYPQVCTFVMRGWASAHAAVIASFNSALAEAVLAIKRDPPAAVARTGTALGYSEPLLLSSVRRTDFEFYSSEQMAQQIRRYYEIVGKPLDASYDPFFYR